MTVYYTARDEAYLAEQREKRGVLDALDLFLCSDGNYRERDAKARYEEERRRANDNPVIRHG